MLEQLEWFCAVLLVIVAAVSIGAVIWGVWTVAEGGIGRLRQARRCSMPARVEQLN